jgi:hypothetical protein
MRRLLELRRDLGYLKRWWLAIVLIEVRQEEPKGM